MTPPDEGNTTLRDEFASIARSYGAHEMFCYLDGVGSYSGDDVLTNIDYHFYPWVEYIPYVAAVTLDLLDRRRGFQKLTGSTAANEALAKAVEELEGPLFDNRAILRPSWEVAALLRQGDPVVSRWARAYEIEVKRQLGHLRRRLREIDVAPS